MKVVRSVAAHPIARARSAATMAVVEVAAPVERTKAVKRTVRSAHVNLIAPARAAARTAAGGRVAPAALVSVVTAPVSASAMSKSALLSQQAPME